MGVITDFDRKRQAAKQAISEALKNLQECIKEDTWGYDDMKGEFIDEIVDMISQLIKMKRRL